MYRAESQPFLRSIGPASSYGQNIGYGIDAEEIDKMIHWMYDEIVKYEPYFGQPDVPSSVFKDVGHFTQIVWKGTSKVGCATKVCQPLGNAASGQALSFTVCNYGPPGTLPLSVNARVLECVADILLQATSRVSMQRMSCARWATRGSLK